MPSVAEEFSGELPPYRGPGRGLPARDHRDSFAPFKAGAVLGDGRHRRDWLPALRSDWAIDQKVGDPAGRRLSRLLLGDPRVVGDGAAGGAEGLLRCQGGAIKFGKQNQSASGSSVTGFSDFSSR